MSEIKGPYPHNIWTPWQDSTEGGRCPFCQSEGDSIMWGLRYHACGTMKFTGPRDAGCYELELLAKDEEIAALKKRLEDILLKDRGKTNEINILTKENNDQRVRLEAWREYAQAIEYGLAQHIMTEDQQRIKRTEEKLKDLGEIE